MAVNIHEERTEFTAVDKMSPIVKGMQRGVGELRSSLDSVQSALAAVGVTVGLGAMVSLAHDVIRANAAFDDLSESVGSSVENLSRVNQVVKIGNHDWSMVGDSLGRMIKGLKGADEEGQNAGRALEFLGIKAKNDQGVFRDSAEIMQEVAQKLAMYQDGANKTALVQDIFGKGAQRLMPLLKDLAQETGVHAKVTGEQAAQAELVEKNINRLRMTMEDARRELVIGMTPSIVEFTEKLLAATKASGGLVAGLALMATSSPDGNIAARLKEIEAEIKAAQAGQSGVANFFTMGGSGVLSGMAESRLRSERDYLLRVQAGRDAAAARAGAADPNSPLFEFGNQALTYQSTKAAGKDRQGLTPYDSAVLGLQQKTAKEQFASSEFMDTSLEIRAGKYGELNAEQKQHILQLAAERDAQRQLKEMREEMTKANEEGRKSSDEYYKSLVAQGEAFKDLLDPGRQYIHDQEKLNELVRQGVLTQDEAVKVQRKLLENRTKVDDFGRSANVAADASRSIGMSFSSAMDRVAFDTERGIHGLDLLKAAALDVLRVIYMRGVVEPSTNALVGGLGGLFGGGSSQGVGMGIGNNSNIGTGGADIWPTMHDGGIVGLESGERRYVHPAYFENAPRLHTGLMPNEFPAVLEKGEGVFTQEQMRALSGRSVTIYQTNNIDARSDQAAIRMMLAQSKRETLALIREADER